MGIRGLNTCINRTIPEQIKPVVWRLLKKSRLGIDINCFLYRALASHCCPVKVIAEQLANFRLYGITPIYVFDGKPPSEKDQLILKRKTDRKDALVLKTKLQDALLIEDDLKIRESISLKIHDLEAQNPVLTYEVRDEIKRLLYATGTMFVTALAEADSLLAYWNKRGIIDAVVSFDLDFLPRGSVLIVPSKIEETVGGTWSYYDPVAIRRGLHLTESEFVDFCVLLGSDYTPNLPIVPWKMALLSIQCKESLSSIWARHTFSNWRRADSNDSMNADLLLLIKAKEILQGVNEHPESLMDEKQWIKWTTCCKKEPVLLKEFRALYSDWPCEWLKV